jgi:hypothetical protein
MMKNSKTVEDRLNQLATWNKLLLVIIVVGLLAFMLSQKPEPGALRAASIQLVDNRGDVLAELAVRDGNPGLYLDDEAGQTRAALFHAPDGTGFYIMDSDGVTRVGIAQFAHGGGGVALHGERSRGAAVLYFKEEGSLRFFDADGRVTNEVSAETSSPSN